MGDAFFTVQQETKLATINTFFYFKLNLSKQYFDCIVNILKQNHCSQLQIYLLKMKKAP